MARTNQEDDHSTQAIQDNRTNLMTEEHLHTAINSVLASPVQSYNQFMDSFLCLRKEDVEENTPNSGKYPQYAQFGGDLETGTAAGATGRRPSTRSNDAHSIGNEDRGIDDLETEELAEGVSSLTQPHPMMPMQEHVKVDNYIDEPYISDSDSDDPLVDDITNLLSDASCIASGLEHVKLTRSLKEHAESDDVAAHDEQALATARDQGPQLPGEADSTAELHQSEMPTTETRLAVRNTTINRGLPSGEAEQQNDEVQPFALDPDFDYDNVELTPKWGDNPRMLRNEPISDPT